MTALISAVIVLVLLGAVITVRRRRGSSDVERFHQARALTSQWAAQGEPEPVFDYPEDETEPLALDRGGSVELV